MPHFTEIDTIVTDDGTTKDVTDIGTGGGGEPTGNFDGGSATTDYGGTDPIDCGGA